MSKLVEHARTELTLIGEEADTINWYLKVVEAFASMGHSGTSADMTREVLNLLLQFKNLSPLTNHPDEWIHHDESVWGVSGGIWQNTRNSEAFSEDGGVTYYLNSEGGIHGGNQRVSMKVNKPACDDPDCVANHSD